MQPGTVAKGNVTTGKIGLESRCVHVRMRSGYFGTNTMKELLISIARAGNICISSLVNLDLCVKRGERIISGFDNSLLSHGEEHIDGLLT